METANNHKITVEATVKAPIEKVWERWNRPGHITGWAFDSDAWEVSAAENDLRVGGKLKVINAAKDGSASFELIGTYTKVKEHRLIEYNLNDGRDVKVEFVEIPPAVKVIETFDPENESSKATQKNSWQATLNSFKKYAESNQ